MYLEIESKQVSFYLGNFSTGSFGIWGHSSRLFLCVRHLQHMEKTWFSLPPLPHPGPRPHPPHPPTGPMQPCVPSLPPSPPSPHPASILWAKTKVATLFLAHNTEVTFVLWATKKVGCCNMAKCRFRFCTEVAHMPSLLFHF